MVLPDLRSKVESACLPAKVTGDNRGDQQRAERVGKGRSKLSLPDTAWLARCQVQGLGKTGRPRSRKRQRPTRTLTPHQKACGILNDTQTDMLLGYPKSAICVQRFDDSLNSAIHITYRNWLRSSSMHEPRDPPLKVVTLSIWHD